MSTAIEEMKAELRRIQIAQEECINEYKIVKTSHRYRYQILVRQAKEFKDSIAWLEAQKEREENFERH